MRGIAARLPLPVALFTTAGILILAGASFDVQGHTGRTAVLVMAGGLLAVLAGVLYRNWQFALICVFGSIIALLGSVPIEQIKNHEISASISQYALINLLGVMALVLSGIVGTRAYALVTAEMRGRLGELESLNAKLEEQHRIFLAATEDPAYLETDAEQRAESTARALGAAFCVYYLATADGRHFIPEGLGFGFEHVRPGPVQRGRKDGLLGAIDSNQEFVTTERRDLAALFRYFPPDFKVRNALAVPIRVGDHVEGFILAGDKRGGFGDDDLRLARTLATRAGISFASHSAVALSQKEAGRYSLLNDLVREASGLRLEEAVAVVLNRGRELIDYEASRLAIFEPDATFTIAGGSAVPSPIARSPLQAVLFEGRTVIRHVTPADGLFSGLLAPEGAQVCEALVPVRGKGEIFGALCLGRKGATGFTEGDIPTLEELGAIAGLAVENSQILTTAVGQATRLDSALDVLGEVSRALTTTTQGHRVLEEQALKAAMRITGCQYALLTRTAHDGTQRLVQGEGFADSIAGLNISNGQGIIGAVMLSGRPLALADATDSLEMMSPPDLDAYGLHAALCVPMIEEEHVRGTIAVFAQERRQWSEDDMRSLSTLASSAVVAIKNAELYDQSRNMIWEISNLHEGLKAVTSTLELEEVLELVLGSAARASDAQIGCLALEEDTGLQLVGSYGTDHATAARLALGLGANIVRDVMESNQPILEHLDRPAGASENPLEPRAVLCVPIPLREKPIGVVFLANYVSDRHFTPNHERLVSSLAAQAAIQIDNARLFRDREELFISTLEVVAQLVDAKDPYTVGHSQRVTEYALALARQMNYAPDDEGAWKRLRQGGLLHDIGKMGVPDHILAKPAPLTTEEFDVMKRHPALGYDILKRVRLLTDELVIVRSHHERYDGRGYPDGKRDLPMCAWIVAVADALDAMTSDRPYRRGMEMAVALGEIKRGAGTHFHPAVARAAEQAALNGSLQLITSKSYFEDAPAVGAFENPVA